MISARFADLQAYIRALGGSFFPEGFETLDKVLLENAILTISSKINAVLKVYHEIDDEEEKMEYSPTLSYCQVLMEKMTRLMRFDEKDLTPFNQILVDLKNMLDEQEERIAGHFTELALYHRRMLKDERFRALAERFIGSFLERQGRDDDGDDDFDEHEHDRDS